MNSYPAKKLAHNSFNRVKLSPCPSEYTELALFNIIIAHPTSPSPSVNPSDGGINILQLLRCIQLQPAICNCRNEPIPNRFPVSPPRSNDDPDIRHGFASRNGPNGNAREKKKKKKMDLICDMKRILNRVSVFLSIRSIYNEARRDGKWNKWGKI